MGLNEEPLTLDMCNSLPIRANKHVPNTLVG
jgi:hypothetical protein